MGRDDQYILAEATQTISLQSDSIYDKKDDLWLGHCVVRTPISMCGYAIARARSEYTARRVRWGSKITSRDSSDYPYSFLEPTIVENMSENEKCKSLPSHGIPPDANFYAAVPIIASSGRVIGIFAVYDDSTRQGLEVQQLRFLRDMATTVAKHLMTVSARVLQTRSERLVKGLALFMEGKSSLRQWFVDEGFKQRNDLADSGNEDGQAISNEATEQYGPEHRRSRSGSRASRPHNAPAWASPDSAKASRSQKPAPRGHHAQRNSSLSGSSGLPVPSQKDTERARSSSGTNEEINVTVDSTIKDDDSLITPAMRSLFSRASNLLREACGVDGVMIYDAGVTENWNSKKKSGRARRPESADAGRSATLSSDCSDSDSQSSLHTEDYADDQECNILGFSVTAKSSLAGNDASSHHHLLRRKILSNMITVYPRGKVFHYEQGESASSSEDADLASASKRHTGRMLREQTNINQIIGGSANCVAFFPLWDVSRVSS